MPNIENNTMSTFTIGGKTFEIEDTSARSDIQIINITLDSKADISDMSNYYTKSETYSKSEVNNLIESSGGGSGDGNSLIVKVTINNYILTLTSTWQEIYDAVAAGKTVVLDMNPYYPNILCLQMVGIVESDYMVEFHNMVTVATSPNGYPSLDLPTPG